MNNCFKAINAKKDGSISWAIMFLVISGEWGSMSFIGLLQRLTHSTYPQQTHGPNIMAKAIGFFPFLPPFFFCLLVSLCLFGPYAPSTPVSTLGHLPGSAPWAWLWPVHWWQVAAGRRAKHVASKKEQGNRLRREIKRGRERQRALQTRWKAAALLSITFPFYRMMEVPS